MLVKIKSGNEKDAIMRIKNLYQAYNRDLPFVYKFLDDDSRATFSEQRVATLFPILCRSGHYYILPWVYLG